MNNTLIILCILFITKLNSQEIQCLNHVLYNSQTDVVRIEKPVDTEIGLQNNFQNSNDLQLIVLEENNIEFPHYTSHYKLGLKYGYKIYLINNSESEYYLNNIYRKVVISRQVFYNNKWRNVNSFNNERRAYCGNGLYSKITMKPNQIYTFVAPCIEGIIKSKFRFIIHVRNGNKAQKVISNEFIGYINPDLIK